MSVGIFACPVPLTGATTTGLLRAVEGSPPQHWGAGAHDKQGSSGFGDGATGVAGCWVIDDNGGGHHIKTTRGVTSTSEKIQPWSLTKTHLGLRARYGPTGS